MPKMKSNSGAGKTFRKTTSGKIQRKKHRATSFHLKQLKRKNLRHATLVSKLKKNVLKECTIRKEDYKCQDRKTKSHPMETQIF
jgi:large subunit ribosomal protein L35